MRYGIITLTWCDRFDASRLDLLPRIAAAGYDFVEIFVDDPAALDASAIADGLQQAGLTGSLCPGINVERDPTSADAETRRRAIAYLQACVDLAVAFGEPLVGGPIYGDQVFYGGAPAVARSKSEALAVRRRAVDSMREVADYAGERGVTLALEPLNRFETGLLCLAEHAAEFVDELDHRAVGVLLDTYHMNVEEGDLPAAIRSVKGRLVHFHANENHRGEPGTGHVDWPGVARALADIGYDGPVVTEPFRRPKVIGESFAFWSPPADEAAEDLVAASSLRFLKETLA